MSQRGLKQHEAMLDAFRRGDTADVLARLADGQSIKSVKAGLDTEGLFFFAIN